MGGKDTDSLLAQAAEEYGTPAERAARAAEARTQSGERRTHGNESGGTPGRRS